MINVPKTKSFSVLIPDGESEHALSVIRCLGQLKNIKIFILSNNPKSEIRFSRYCHQFLSYENRDKEVSRLMAICDTIKKIKPDVVLPVDVVTIPLLSENIGLISDLTSVVSLPTLDSFNIANNKWLLAQWLKCNQISSPATILFKKDEAGFDDVLSSFSFPALLKPSSGSGGKGIKLFENETSLRDYCDNNTFSSEFILQSFISGYDLDCSILCENGKILAYTIQKGFVNGRNQFTRATGLDFINDSNTLKLVSEVAEKLNWTGIAHLDLRFDENDREVKLIEINPRYWASLMGSLTCGVNFPYIASLVALKSNITQCVPKEIRYIQGGLALKKIATNIMHRDSISPKVETSIKFILDDPLPTISYFVRGIMKNKKPDLT